MTGNHKERTHAVLSASGAEKWLNCPPSVRLEENEPEKFSVYAEEGTLAHELGELKAHKHFIKGIGHQTYTKKVAEIQKKLEMLKDKALSKQTQEPENFTQMDRYTDDYLQYLKDCALRYPSKPYIALEKQVNYNLYVPDGFGTCDAIMIHEDEMRIIDLKYGKGVPKDAKHNPQLMLYALGALTEFQILFPIKKIILAIFQPRIDYSNEWETTAEDIFAFGESIKPIAEKAFNGEGEYKSGDHCRFCKVSAQCRARAEEIVKVFDKPQKNPALLSDSEIGEMLGKVNELTRWAEQMKQYALEQILTGREIEGWKAVEGRAIRAFTDTDAAFSAIISAGTPEEMLYERKPLTLAQIEKMLGKKEFASIAGNFISFPQGKPTLVPNTDKRPAISIKKIFEENQED